MNQSMRTTNQPTRWWSRGALPFSVTALGLTLTAGLTSLGGCPGPTGGTDPADLSLPAPTADMAVTFADMAMARPQQPGCSKSEWCWQHPTPQGNVLWSVFAVSATEAWAVGDSGTMLHMTGGQWQPLISQTPAALYAVWGTDPNNVFAVGDRATVLRWDGSKWTQLPITDNTGMMIKPTGLYGIWGSSKNDMWIVGSDGVILKWDGSTVTRIANGAMTTLLRSVWGSGPSSVYAAGAAGTILKWDGTRWATFPSMTNEYLTSIWGSGDSNIFVGSSSGLIRRWNGTAWSIANNFNNYGIYSIWGTDPANVFAVGDILPTDPTRKDGTKRLATFLKWDGTSKFVDVDTVNAPKVGMFGLHGTSAQNLMAVGSSGTIVTYTGGTFKSSSNVDILTGVAGPVTGITGSSPTDLVAVADWGTTLRYSGNAWSVVASSPYIRFRGVAGSADNLFSVAYDFTPGMEKPLLQKWNGTAWMAETITGTTSSLRAIAVSGTNAYAVGDSETIVKRSGTTWTKQMVNLPGQSTLRGVWASGDTVWAVGGGDYKEEFVASTYPAKAMISTGGSQFMQVTIPVSDKILRAIWGTDPTNVWAVGDEGTVLKWDGMKWTVVPTNVIFSLRAIWGRSATDFYIAGTGGAILHWNGTSFMQEDSGTNAALVNIFGVGNTLYATGTSAAILKKSLQ